MIGRLSWSAVLAALAIAMASARFGWKGAAGGITLTVFWMLLQFNSIVRIMRRAGEAPVGHVHSVVMLQSRLKAGQRLLDVVSMTGSLGERLDPPVPDADVEAWRWTDDGGDRLSLVFRKGRLAEWRLARTGDLESAT